MDTVLSKIQKDAIMNIFINDIILPKVNSIRKQLSAEYDITNGYFKNYTGLCNEASKEFCNQMNTYFNEHKDLAEELHAEVKSIHGEQRHLPRIESKHWPIQHTWCCVKFARMIVYVDITSQQFQDIYNDIPDYYISKKKPKWFYSDKENIAWQGMFKIPHWINQHVKVPHKLEDRIVEEGLIEFIQYEIWGKISDRIYKLKRR